MLVFLQSYKATSSFFFMLTSGLDHSAHEGLAEVRPENTKFSCQNYHTSGLKLGRHGRKGEEEGDRIISPDF